MRAPKIIGLHLLVLVLVPTPYFLVSTLIAPRGEDVDRSVAYMARIKSIIEDHGLNKGNTNVVMIAPKRKVAGVAIKNPFPSKEEIERLLRAEHWQDDLEVKFEDDQTKFISTTNVAKTPDGK